MAAVARCCTTEMALRSLQYIRDSIAMMVVYHPTAFRVLNGLGLQERILKIALVIAFW
jgi:hypothetical protein